MFILTFGFISSFPFICLSGRIKLNFVLTMFFWDLFVSSGKLKKTFKNNCQFLYYFFKLSLSDQACGCHIATYMPAVEEEITGRICILKKRNWSHWRTTLELFLEHWSCDYIHPTAVQVQILIASLVSITMHQLSCKHLSYNTCNSGSEYSHHPKMEEVLCHIFQALGVFTSDTFGPL